MKTHCQQFILTLAFFAGLLVCPAISHAQASNSTKADPAYIVQSGDTLVKIARQFGITVNALIQANGLNSTKILIGQKLNVPDARGLGTDRILVDAIRRTADAVAAGRECSSSASVVGSIVSCDARYQGSMPLAPSAPQPASSPP